MPTAPIVDFLNRVVTAFGITATVQVEETADGPRLGVIATNGGLTILAMASPASSHPTTSVTSSPQTYSAGKPYQIQ